MSQGDFREMVDAYKDLRGKDRVWANVLIGTLAAGALIAFIPPIREAVSDLGELVGIFPDSTVSSDSYPPALDDLYRGAAIHDPAEAPAGPAPTELPSLPSMLAD